MRLRSCFVGFFGLLLSVPSRVAYADDDVYVHGSQAAGFVGRASVDDAPREVTDAASLIEPLPGVHVRRLGADDAFATLSIRGSSSSQVAVYLAGVPLSGGADPTLDLATLPLWPGSHARVHRSFAPAALGRGSLGGTLVIDPPSPRETPRTDVWAAVGAFGARRLRLGDVRDAGNGTTVASGISTSRSDDDFRYLDPNASLSGGDVYTTRSNAGHAAAAGLVSIGVPVRTRDGDGALTVTALAQARRQQNPGAATWRTPGQRLESSRLLGAVKLTLPVRGVTFGVRGWGRRDGLSLRDDPRTVIVLQPTSTDDAIVAAGGSGGFRAEGGAGSVEVRLDGSGERFAPGTWIGAQAPPGARRLNGGVGLDASTRPIAGITLAASGRLDTWHDTSDDGADMTQVRPTGNVGLELPLGPVTFATHGGFVARPPSFVERYGNRGGFLGDPRLRPESAAVVDAGGRIARRIGHLKFRAEVAAFGTWADDLIVFVAAGAYRLQKATNIGRARLLGAEASASASAYGLDARLSHTELVTTNEGECSFARGACDRPPLPGRPAHDFVADLAYTRGPLRVRYGLDFVSGMRADTGGETVIPSRLLHSAGVRLIVPRVPGLSLSLDVRNLLDLRVAEYAGVGGPTRAPIGDLFDYPLPGRRVLLSLQWKAASSVSSDSELR